MDLLAVSNLSNGPVINIIQWLQAERLLVHPLRCVPCNRPMDLIERNQGHVDGYIWLVQFSHSACCRVSHYYRVRSRQFVSKYTYAQGLFKLGLCSSFFTGPLSINKIVYQIFVNCQLSSILIQAMFWVSQAKVPAHWKRFWRVS